LTKAFSSVGKSVSRGFGLKAELQELVPQVQARAKSIMKEHGQKEWGKVTVAQVAGGMRDVSCMLYDTSSLDPMEGIRFRGATIPDLVANLQKAPGGTEPLPEGVLWLLLTGKYPTDAQFKEFSADLKSRETIPQRTIDMIRALPRDTHPMTMLSMALMSLQKDSVFAQAYTDGVHKSKYWEVVYEDSLNLLAQIPLISAMCYRHAYHNGDMIASDPNLDWAGNYSHMLGYKDEGFRECIRGYLAMHSDHEGGNVSAHTCHLVGSALADPYLSYAAAVNGLAGPLHGLANQEVLKFMLDLQKSVGSDPSEDQIRAKVWEILNSGRVIPGYGHAVLRNTDPRYVYLNDFAERYIKDDP